MRTCTCPLTLHDRYSPPEKAVTARLSSTAPVLASTRLTVSLRSRPSQSRKYSDSRCAWPSVKLTSRLKSVELYHVEAMRSAGLAAFCRARASPVEAAQVQMLAVWLRPTCAQAGRRLLSLGMTEPAAPKAPCQLPCTAVLTPTNAAVAPGAGALAGESRKTPLRRALTEP